MLDKDDLLAFSGGDLKLPVVKQITGFSIDTRTIKEGDVFFALRGMNVDGHDFASDAANRGAACIVIDSQADTKSIRAGVIKVADTFKAIQQIAGKRRRQMSNKVIAVTGSAGKTTTKEILVTILKQQFSVCASEGNFNNELGLPLTVLNADNCEILVLEMAMRGRGQIKKLCEIAMPDHGIITNIGKSHLEELGSEENIALAKAELGEALGSHSILALNSGDKWTPLVRKRSQAEIKTFGFSGDADCRISDLSESYDKMRFQMELSGSLLPVETDVPGRHMAENIAAASLIAFSLGVKPDIIVKTVQQLAGRLSRQSVVQTENITIINDTYNASPDSMERALNILRLYNGRRKIAVLGSMAELGKDEQKYHLELGRHVADSSVDILVTVGDLSLSIYEGAAGNGFGKRHEHYPTAAAASEKINEIINYNDVVLVKGSRFLKMEQIVGKLAGASV